MLGQIKNLFANNLLNDELLEDLEDILVSSDVGINTSEQIITELKTRYTDKSNDSKNDVFLLLKEILIEILTIQPPSWIMDTSGSPLVILMVGVNGAGKTTTIAKLTNWYLENGKEVLVGAGDTFRAAAPEQLKSWADKLSVQMISHQSGSDPGAVAFDTISAAKSRKVDVAIIDTAGRLQDKSNLMEELKKIHRISMREAGDSRVKVLLTIDATTGQNGISQARSFQETVQCDGVFLSKLDGSAKGGIALSIVKDVRLPILFVGTGEEANDMALFDANQFVDSLIESEINKN
ncbi:MAG: signal recognition particle-docking protein FtsY [Dehalococcoidia bacterium]